MNIRHEPLLLVTEVTEMIATCHGNGKSLEHDPN